MDIKGIKKVRPKKRPFFCKLIYNDGKILTSHYHNLRGRPDVIFSRFLTGGLLPMEIKSGEAKDMPYYGDVMQLVAYFVIIEEVFGRKPRKGFLRYCNAMFVIKNSKKRRKELLQTVQDMRRMLETSQGTAAPSFVRCRHCVARDTVCEFAEHQLN